MRQAFRFFLVAASMITLAGGLATAVSKQTDRKQQVAGLRSALPPLELDEPPVHSDAVRSYFDFYGLAFEDVVHHFGSIPAAGFTIATHVYRPAEPVGTVFVVHGYLDHSGLLGKLVRYLLDLGYAVVTFDLPGHGLSSGQPAGIDAFRQYTDVFLGVYDNTGDRLPAPHHVVAHSTGCAMTLILMQTREELPFEKIVFLAPLVRSAFWKLSVAGAAVADPFVDTVPRKFMPNSADRDFLKFVKNDPLQAHLVPMTWVRALHAWNEEVEGYEARQVPLLIIQGTRDRTVDWQYNLTLLKRVLPAANIERIKGANHQLMNESEPLRTRVFQLAGDYLSVETEDRGSVGPRTGARRAKDRIKP